MEQATYHYNQRHNKSILNLNNFLANYSKQKGDESTRFIDRAKGNMYYIPDDKLNEFFSLYEICRKGGIKLHFQEKQDLTINELEEKEGGIMLDFDCYYPKTDEGTSNMPNTFTSRIIHESYKEIYRLFIRILRKLIDLPQKWTFTSLVIKKSEVKFDENKQMYKDGIHILIPDIKLPRIYRKYIISEMINSGSVILGMGLISTVLDVNSSHVPVHLLGSCKLESEVYKIDYVIKYEINETEIESHIMISDTITAKQFSLNFSDLTNINFSSLIKENVREMLKPRQIYETKREENFCSVNKDISLLTTNDHLMKDVKLYLDVINDKLNYNDRLSIIFAIYNMNPTYKELARWFIMKNRGDKYNEADFNAKWIEASKYNEKSSSKQSCNIQTIKFIVKHNNPVEYKKVLQKTLDTQIVDSIFKFSGNLPDTPIANILDKAMGEKYIFASKNSLLGCTGEWYMFVGPNDLEYIRDGKIYKWVKAAGASSKLKKFINTKLDNYFNNARRYISQIKMRKTDTDEIKVLDNIIRKLNNRLKKLEDYSGYTTIIKTFGTITSERSYFLTELDKDDMVIGVNNGVLVIEKVKNPEFDLKAIKNFDIDMTEFEKIWDKPEQWFNRKTNVYNYKFNLIETYHTYPISKSTSVDYEPCDFNNKNVQFWIKFFRDIFIEFDAFIYIMVFFGSLITGETKEPLLFTLDGRGKNAKTTLIEAIAHVLGDYSQKSRSSILYETKNESSASATSQLIALKDARFVYFSETSQGQVLNASRIKELTGGDTISGRQLHCAEENFEIKAGFCYVTNNRLLINSFDDGTLRRLVCYTILVKFCSEHEMKQDPNNPYNKPVNPKFNSKYKNDKKKLKSLFSLLTHFYLMYKTVFDGSIYNVKSETIIKNTNQYKESMDHLSRFIDTKIVKSSHGEIYKTADIADKYILWYKTNINEIGLKESKLDTIASVENSVLQKIFKKNLNGENVLSGFRILIENEVKEVDESFIFEMKRAKAPRQVKTTKLSVPVEHSKDEELGTIEISANDEPK